MTGEPPPQATPAVAVTPHTAVAAVVDAMAEWDGAHLDQDEAAVRAVVGAGFTATHRHRVGAAEYLDIHFRRGLQIHEYATTLEQVDVRGPIVIAIGTRRIAGVRGTRAISGTQFVSTVWDFPDGKPMLVNVHVSDLEVP